MLITGLLALAGCGGGSGTPLPQPQKTAKITFYAISTARNHDLIISDYVIQANPIILPSGLTVSLSSGDAIADSALNSYNENLATGSFAQNFYPLTGAGKVELSISNFTTPPTNIGFGKIAEMTCVLSNQSLTKQALYANYTSLNHSNDRIATAKHYDPADPLASKTTAVFYNISVSVQ